MRLEYGGTFDVLLRSEGIKWKKEKNGDCCDIFTLSIFLCLVDDKHIFLARRMRTGGRWIHMLTSCGISPSLS